MTVSAERLADDLPTAIAHGDIYAVFQPQIDMASGEIVAVEALARWNHPVFGPVSPLDFIPVAEDTHVIHLLGRSMIEQAIACLLSLRDQGVSIEVSVNVSATQLEAIEFYDRLDHDLAVLGLEPGALNIEITESQPVLEVPSIVARLWQLRHEGLGISIDDYGTGHSSLRQLDRVPATELKLDQSLVRDTGPEVTQLIKAVVELAHYRGIRVVAEGIETHDQLERMRELHCDRAQGFLLSLPLSRVDLEAQLTA